MDSTTLTAPQPSPHPEYPRSDKTAQKAKRRALIREAVAAVAAGLAPQIRKDAAWTELDVANVLGVRVSFVKAWETGRKPLFYNDPLAYSYAKLLHVLADKPVTRRAS